MTQKSMGFQRILVAIDRSELCQAVFEQALELAQACQAQLLLFHCLILAPNVEAGVPAVPVGMSDLGIYPRLVDNRVWEQQFQDQQQLAMALLQSYQDRASGSGITTEFVCKVGAPGHCICEAARAWTADLILVGRRGRSGLAEALLGSISNYVVHHAPCAVLVIQ